MIGAPGPEWPFDPTIRVVELPLDPNAVGTYDDADPDDRYNR